MSQKIIYCCDNCKKECEDYEIIKESIPFIKENWACGGKANVKLVFGGYSLEFEEQDLCSSCLEKYKQVWTNGMISIAEQWMKVKI